MEQSETVIELLTALCAARLEFPAIERNRVGFAKRGGQEYGYADLNAIIDATAPVLAAHGLTIMQFLEDGPEPAQATVKSILFHLSGQWIASHLTVMRPNDPQEFGITTTYAKRYMQQAMLNLSTEGEDQDGKITGASQGKERRRDVASRPTSEPKASQVIPQATVAAITLDEMQSLSQLAEGAGFDRVKFGDDMRLLLGLDPGAKLTRKFLCETMTREQYEDRRQRYTDLIHTDQRDDVPDFSGPEDATQPEADTQESGEGGSGSDGQASSIEVSSVAGEAITSNGEPSNTHEPPEPSDDFRAIEVDVEGYAVEGEMAKLKQLAIEQGKQAMHRDMLRETPQMNEGRYRYCWIELGRKKAVKV